MTFSEILCAAVDFWRPNRYGLEKYLLNDGRPHPFAVICPGGGYGMVCSFLEGLPYAKALNALGYHAFVVYYRVRGKARYPAPQEDLERAVREIFAHADEWMLDTNGYSLWGSSAGGHLAASFCTENRPVPRPAALVLCYPVVTMGKLTHRGSRESLLGKSPAPELISRLSVEARVTPDFPPTFVWCGTADRTVDPANSRMLADALAANGVPHEFREYPGVDHGVGVGRGLACEGWLEKAVRFWDSRREEAGRE